MTKRQEDLLLHLIRHGDWAGAVAFCQDEWQMEYEDSTDLLHRIARRNGLALPGRAIGRLIVLSLITTTTLGIVAAIICGVISI
ncbi:MAG: hypothetical protein AAFP69_13820 [Planctomycetota bacterium]